MIFVVFAVGALLGAGAVLTGVVLGTHPGVIAAEVFGCIAVPQFAFVAVSLTEHRPSVNSSDNTDTGGPSGDRATIAR